MEVMYLLIAFSLLIASGFLLAFMWAVRSGQYDDRYTPSVRMLMDDIMPGKKKDSDRPATQPDKPEAADGRAVEKSVNSKEKSTG
ncbi:MAG: cbb3-type cytochrome oxidase assembly protein CcoS [Rhodothermaceae bacterium]|nr:cbb3-type cytochrome oxidase assembly protein CcoS [Rhodothermaceae bacterium]